MRFLYLLPVILLSAGPAFAGPPPNRLRDQLNSVSPSINSQRRPQSRTSSQAASNQGFAEAGPQSLPVIPYRGG